MNMHQTLANLDKNLKEQGYDLARAIDRLSAVGGAPYIDVEERTVAILRRHAAVINSAATLLGFRVAAVLAAVEEDGRGRLD